MSNAAQGNKRQITSLAPFRLLFVKGNEESRVGIETEFLIGKKVVTDYGDSIVMPIDNEDNARIRAALAFPEEYGFDFDPVYTDQEAGTTMLEIQTDAASLEDMERILEEQARKMQAVTGVCGRLGYVLFSSAQPPDFTLTQLYNSVVDKERAQVFMPSFHTHDMDDLSRNFFFNSGVQASVSFRGPDHLLCFVRRLSFLTPVLATAHDNSPGKLEGRADPAQTGLRLRQALQQYGRGGIPDFFLEAKNGEEFIENYLDWTATRKRLATYDENGKNLQGVAPGDEACFADLMRTGNGLSHQTNFELMFGMVWPHAKLGFIKDKEGKITGVRIEARIADVGEYQRESFPLIIAALALDEDFGRAVDKMLGRYGFDVDHPAGSKERLERSIGSAIRYEDSYGTGRLTAALREFANSLDGAFAGRPHLRERLGPFLEHIAHPENSPSRGLRAVFDCDAKRATAPLSSSGGSTQQYRLISGAVDHSPYISV